jgi:hypothetical protein
MKKFFALFICVALFCASGSALSLRAQAAGAAGPMVTESDFQAAESKLNMVSLDVLRFLGFFNLSYTRAITPAISLTAQLELPSNLITGFAYNESGFGGRLEARYNFAQKNLVGIFVAPVVGFNSSTFGPPGGGESFFTTSWFALGAMAGYQFAPFGGLPELMLGFGLGAEYNIITSTINPGLDLPTGLEPSTANGVLPRFRFTIGYAF